jgi:uncharacterized membrane protein
VILRTANRLPAIDIARGGALLAMFVYHVMWDLASFGVVGHDFATSPPSKFFAHSIAFAFLILVGISLSLAARNAPRRAFWQRLGRIALAAAAISIVTWFVFRDQFIYFGILHCIALSSLLALPLRQAPIPVVLGLAIGAIAVPYLFQSPFFNAPIWLWLGLSTEVPASVDYQPLAPGFGIVLLGLCIGRIISSPAPEWMQRAARGPILATLEFGGKHSLVIYLLHQPVFFVMLFGAVQVFGSNAVKFEADFIDSCQAKCRDTAGTDPRICAESCSCVVRELKGADLWTQYQSSKLTVDEHTQVSAILDVCSRRQNR